ncbi:MAG: bifunctional 5,10-methylenetetrahydrofolate dehydrogenase/5,10-methenyltetrahydrofolate cyclohydrolase [Candidatus Saccharimonadales bacterium]|jgi:methylenetetrahydrofolate dehydrogenase (NADP+)/methenyltetrahydrofolate cyclohydrolase
MKILNGQELAGFIKERHAKQVRSLRGRGIRPKLAIVQVKDDPVINTYVRLKKQYGADVGIDVDIHTLQQKDAPKLLNKLSNDDSIHSIIVQLPLTDPSQTDEIVNLVAPQKDVDALGDPDAPWPPLTKSRASHKSAVQGKDGQQTESYMKYGEGVAQSLTPQRTLSDDGASGSARRQDVTVRGTWFEPATPMAIMWLLAGYGVDLAGKHILLVGRGKLVGAPLEKILKASGYEVEVIGREVKNLSDYTKKADVIITATGSPAVLYPDMIKTGAVVVDAGVASESGKTVGDLAPEVYQRDDLIITPEKGGVGPLTVCALFENVIRAADNLPRTKS